MIYRFDKIDRVRYGSFTKYRGNTFARCSTFLTRANLCNAVESKETLFYGGGEGGRNVHLYVLRGKNLKRTSDYTVIRAGK